MASGDPSGKAPVRPSASGDARPVGDARVAGFAARLLSLIDWNETFDRRTLLQLTAWGVSALAALAGALTLARTPLAENRGRAQIAQTVQQLQQAVQQTATDNRNDTRRLAAAIDVLNGDRDRLFARVTVLEHDAEVITGAIAKDNRTDNRTDNRARTALPPPLIAAATAVPWTLPAAALSPIPAPGESVAAVADTKEKAAPAKAEAIPAVAPAPASESKSESKAEPKPVALVAAPPPAEAARAATRDSGGEKVPDKAPVETPESAKAPAEEVAVPQTAFGIDLGSARSIAGLRALWNGARKSQGQALTGLRPIMAIKEGRGAGLQLHLIAGPLADAAAAAKLCAALIAAEWNCESTIYDGQQLPLGERKSSGRPSAKSRSGAREAATKPLFSFR